MNTRYLHSGLALPLTNYYGRAVPLSDIAQGLGISLQHNPAIFRFQAGLLNYNPNAPPFLILTRFHLSLLMRRNI